MKFDRRSMFGKLAAACGLAFLTRPEAQANLQFTACDSGAVPAAILIKPPVPGIVTEASSFFGIVMFVSDECPTFSIQMPPESVRAKVAVPVRIQIGSKFDTAKVIDLREDLRRMDGSDLSPEDSREAIRGLIRLFFSQSIQNQKQHAYLMGLRQEKE